MQKCVFSILLLLLVACSEHEPSEFQIAGLSKNSVLQHLGEPPQQTHLNGWQINEFMGPKPKLAQDLADEDTVEMWQYRVTDDRAAEVFFNEDGTVAEVIFVRTDVMY